MTSRISFLREQTLTGANKCKRTPLSSDFSTADVPVSLPERKALGLSKLFEEMPVFIGEQELIVGTRTLFFPQDGNEDGHDRFAYHLNSGIPYVTAEEIAQFGADQSFVNKTHYTPDFSILLENGIGGILGRVNARSADETLTDAQRAFLSSVKIAYEGLQTLILRYAKEAQTLAAQAKGEEQARLLKIASVCTQISKNPPNNFYEAVQLLWFGHLGTIIESFEFINYGRLDVILYPYLGDMPHDEARELLSCLLLKMYDQVDITETYLNKYAAQLVVTLGGVDSEGNNAVNDVTMLFLEAIDAVRLPEPEFNLRINSVNPPEFLDKAATLTVSGCNFISYYNDDRFIEQLSKAIPLPLARQYGFDLCQDINIPGKSDFYTSGELSLSFLLMDFLKRRHSFDSFASLMEAFKEELADTLASMNASFQRAQRHLFLYRDGQYQAYFDEIKQGAPIDWYGRSPMCPLPYLSALYHGTIDAAVDMVYESYPIKEKGLMIGTATEAINSLAAIKKVVYDEKQYSLSDVVQACADNYQTPEQSVMRHVLWNAPKWGNDDDFVDAIAKDLLGFCLTQATAYETASGGKQLGGIHQPHPVPTGAALMATPEGRYAGAPVAVTLTPESGTMQNGPTAALLSASKLCSFDVQWNFCVMVNYYSSVFEGTGGKEVFKTLLRTYFEQGGMQHQPNVLNVEDLKAAQREPEKYKDLIVRLWGVSAHFVDLPKELQDEMIARVA